MATITLQNDTAVISKGSLNHLNVNGVWCAPALVNGDLANSGVQYVLVFGNGTADAVVIDESGGMFEPGIIPDVDATLPAGIEGKNDVEFVLAGVPAGAQVIGGVESLVILGNAAADKITIGDDSTPDSLDRRRRPDRSGGRDREPERRRRRRVDPVAVRLRLVIAIDPEIGVDGQGGDDVISGKRSHGTGVADDDGLALSGGAGNDHVQGGEGDDILVGGPGDDVLDGNGSSENPVAGADCGVEIDLSTGEPRVPGVGDRVTKPTIPGRRAR
ncbi:MAG: hypothetical protein U0R69_01105 [Gaiellales bacterium]